jgi:hypothetical protein
MVSRRKLLGCNFHWLTIADGSYWAITFIGPPLAKGSCDGNFRQPPWPTEFTNFILTSVGQVKPMEVS